MFERFNFYDFYGYFVPGTYALLAIATLVIGAATLVTGDFPAIASGGITGSVLFLVAAYLAGHALQSCAKLCAFPAGNDRTYSESYLLGVQHPGIARRPLSREALTTLHARLSEEFGLPPMNLTASDARDIAQERFRLAYSWSIALKRFAYVEIYNGLYSLYRGLYCVSFLGFRLLASALLLWFSWYVNQVLDGGGRLNGDQTVALIGWLLAEGFFWITIQPFRKQHSDFACMFVEAVCADVLRPTGDGKKEK